MPVIDMARRELGRRDQCRIGVLDGMMLLEARLQPLQDLDGFGNRGLHDVDLLEAPRQGMVLFKYPAIFLVGGRPDAAQLAIGEHRLDQVGCVHHTARGGARADHRVDFIYEQDRAGNLLQLRNHPFQAFFRNHHGTWYPRSMSPCPVNRWCSRKVRRAPCPRR